MIMTIIILLLPDYNFYDLWFVYDHSAFLLTIIMIIIINENSHIFRQKLLWDDRLLEDIGEVFKQSLALNIIYLLLDELFVELYENLPAVICSFFFRCDFLIWFQITCHIGFLLLATIVALHSILVRKLVSRS